MISFGAASCSLMTSSYRCCCLVSILLLFLSTQRGPCRRNCKVGTSTLSYYLLGARSKRSPEADQSLEQSKGTDAIRSGGNSTPVAALLQCRHTITCCDAARKWPKCNRWLDRRSTSVAALLQCHHIITHCDAARTCSC